MPAPKEYKLNIIKELRSKESLKFKTSLHISQWIIDGKEKEIVLEKRYMEKYQDQWQPRKATGFTSEDLKFVVSNSQDIIDVMDGKIKPEDAKIEEVKF